MTFVRLLGKCPNCGSEDSISTRDGHDDPWTANCEKCGATWVTFYELVSAEKQRGNRLIPIEVVALRNTARLKGKSPRELPHWQLIEVVLNAAVIIHSGIDCSATRGGVSGSIDGEYIELRGNYDWIGLISGNGFLGERRQAILRWYADLLVWLFGRNLFFRRKSFGCGAIFKIVPPDPFKVGQILWTALYRKTSSRLFANRVFEKARVDISTSIRCLEHLGLTNKQLIESLTVSPLD